jgi:hypothetical protein
VAISDQKLSVNYILKNVLVSTVIIIMEEKCVITTVSIDFNTLLDDVLFMYLMKSQGARIDPWCEDWQS